MVGGHKIDAAVEVLRPLRFLELYWWGSFRDMSLSMEEFKISPKKVLFLCSVLLPSLRPWETSSVPTSSTLLCLQCLLRIFMLLSLILNLLPFYILVYSGVCDSYFSSELSLLA